MEDKTIRRNLYRVLRKTGVQKEDIKENASFSYDLNFDNVDWQIFTYYLEGVFNISVEEEQLVKMEKVNDTLRFLGKTA